MLLAVVEHLEEPDDLHGDDAARERRLGHEAPEPRAYGTFVELTHLVGALGFAPAVDLPEGIRRTIAWYREKLGAATA